MPNPSGNKIYSVDTLTSEIRKLLELSYADIWVEGEVSSLSSPPSGHLYFTLKDQNSVLKCVLFKNRRYLASALPAEGERFLIRGRISVYTARGDVQMICSYLEAAGEGELRRRFEAMKNKLAAEGLFDPEHKQPLPERPSEIALITSSHGAVLHDIISTLRRRYPLVTLKLLAVSVQGEAAAREICQALNTADASGADLVILARGGGSLEDLQAFNEEAVARAVFKSRLPVVSAIGHETDFVITDFVADTRAPTPTAAATMVTPDITELAETLAERKRQLKRLVDFGLNQRQQQLDLTAQKLKHPRDHLLMQAGVINALSLNLSLLCRQQLQQEAEKLRLLKNRLLARSPENSLNHNQLRLSSLKTRLDYLLANKLGTEQARLKQFRTALQAFGPRQTLARGYSILQDEHGQVVRSSKQVNLGESLQARLHHGRLDLTVSGRHEEPEQE